MRRDERLPFSGVVQVSWQDAHGAQRFMRGTCLGISPSGMRAVLPEAIPLRTYVTLAADQTRLVTSASVRHVACVAPQKHLTGFEFSSRVDARYTRRP